MADCNVSESTVVDEATSSYVDQFPYKYPSFRRVKLAAVKDALYHPRPPTFRAMDRDTGCHKLSEDHCQSSTIYGAREFQEARDWAPTKRCAAMPFLPGPPRRGYTAPKKPDISLPDTNKIQFNITKKEWDRYVDTDKRFRFPIYNPKYYRFKHHVIRYIEEDMTRSTPFKFKQEPNLEGWKQRPIPANIQYRYRHLSPQFRINEISTSAWY